MAKVRIYLFGGDDIGWAMDEDLARTRCALAPIAEFTDLDQCEVAHSVWWWRLIDIAPERLAGKRVICHLSGEPMRLMGLPEFRRARARTGCFIAQSSQARRQLDALALKNTLIPYAVDTNVFRPLPADDKEVEAMRARWSIPRGRFLIGSFHRDTEGADLKSPKLVKGPDLFLEIVSMLMQLGAPVHVLLAGPRRMWLRGRLRERGVPFTFVGEETAGDDVAVNTLPLATLNLLYNLCGLYLITSRSEGGPRSVLEAGAAGCKVLSTPVGLAEDALLPENIYRAPDGAAERIAREIAGGGALERCVPAVRTATLERHTAQALSPLFASLYAALESIPRFEPPARPAPAPRPTLAARVARRIVRAVRPQPPLTVGLWHTFYKPPYGGGNQFMLALRKGLLALGARVRENELRSRIGAYVLNSVQFDVERFERYQKRYRLRVLHRIDGPIHLIRGHDRESDERCFDLNRRFASATVIQSNWCYQRILEMGYEPVNAVIVRNACDPDVFHPRGRAAFDPGRKIRLISSSWSDNPRKGGTIYKWIEDHLDWGRYEYTFVGRASEKFSRIRQIAPLPSEPLADLLRQHDIFITASSNDPCSNAVIEALSCGLPVLYLNDGGHPELVGLGGLPFNSEEEIMPQLDRLAGNYAVFQNLITAPRLADVAGVYLRLLKEIAES